MGLLPRAVDVAGPARRRWLLTDADTGAPRLVRVFGRCYPGGMSV
jgi:hypothetical protein